MGNGPGNGSGAGRGPILVLMGSNIAPERHLPEAFRRLAARVTVAAVSRVYETDPVTRWRESPRFLNAAVRIETDLSPQQLKADVLRAIEAELGRVRIPGDKTAPRVIDLDLVLFGDRVQSAPELPDPSLFEAAYAAVPAAELAPDFIAPGRAEPLARIAAGLGQGGVRVREDLRLDR